MGYNQATIKKMGAGIKRNPLDVFELVYFNNPVDMIKALRGMNLTRVITPKDDVVEDIVKQLIVKRDVQTMKRIIAAVPYKADATNFTTAPELWTEIGVPAGDFNQAFANTLAAMK